MFQTAVIASGSKGNCFLVRTEQTKLIIDAGLSAKRVLEAMASLKLDHNKVEAVLISHEHSDHIKGAGVLCRKLNIPLYITDLTYNLCRARLGKLPLGVHHFKIGERFEIGDLLIDSFPASHDGIDGANFIIEKIGESNRKLALVTDLGYSSRLTKLKMQKATTLILECNHDVELLLDGPYPWHLKQRIRSRHGHLSNDQAIELFREIMHPELVNVILAHLSEVNNCPDLVEKLWGEFLRSINSESKLLISSQYEPTPLVDI